jgi:hypothetical protein
MICSADKRLANDMRFPVRERKLTVSTSDDKPDLGASRALWRRAAADTLSRFQEFPNV